MSSYKQGGFSIPKPFYIYGSINQLYIKRTELGLC